MKSSQILNFVKIIPVGAELFFTDGQMNERTDMTKLMIVFRHFANSHIYLLLLCVDLSIFPSEVISLFK